MLARLVAVAIGPQIPGIFAEEFGYGAKHDTFHHHLTVQGVIAVQLTHPLDGDAVQNDAPILVVDHPSLNDTVDLNAVRGRGNLKVHVRQLISPHTAQVVHRVGDGHHESLAAATQGR